MSQYVTAPPESDTVHSGPVYYKQKAKFSSNYILYTGFLLHESTRGPKRIELHNEGAHSSSAAIPNVVIFLDSNVSHQLGTAKKSKSVPPHKFVVTVGSAKHLFRLSSKEASVKWAEMFDRAINGPPLEGHTYEFPVTILSTKHADDLQLNGCYILKITDTHVLLYSSNGALPTKFQCPLECVTKAHCTRDPSKQPILIINTSSASPIGEGGFAFTAQAAETISNIISHRHNLVEPPLPPRNKISMSSSAARLHSESPTRQLTTSHSSDDILQSQSGKRAVQSNSEEVTRTPSMDMLDMAPLPPPRPRASLPPDESTTPLHRNVSPHHSLEHWKWTQPNTHAPSNPKLPKPRHSLDQSIPPPIPRSPRPQAARHAKSVDSSSSGPSEPSPPPSARHRSLGLNSLTLTKTDHHTGPSKHNSFDSGGSVFSLGNGSQSPAEHTRFEHSTSGTRTSSFFTPPPPPPPLSPVVPTCQNSSNLHWVSEQMASPVTEEGEHTMDPEGIGHRKGSTASRAEGDENDFDSLDNWIKNRALMPSSTSVPSQSSSSPQVSSAPRSPRPSLSTPPPVPTDAQEPSEFYDYSRRGELSLCSSQTTNGYLKLIA